MKLFEYLFSWLFSPQKKSESDSDEKLTKEKEYEERKKLFYAHRERSLSIAQSNREKHDAAILTLSTAVLGGSVAILKDFALKNTNGLIYILITAWFLFAVSISLIILSFLLSNKDIDTSIDIARRYYLDYDDNALSEKNKFSDYMETITVSAGLLFITAVLMLVCFVSLIVAKGITMSSEKIETRLATPDAKKAVTSPSLQRVPPSNPPTPAPKPTTSSNGSSTPNERKK